MRIAALKSVAQSSDLSRQTCDKAVVERSRPERSRSLRSTLCCANCRPSSPNVFTQRSCSCILVNHSGGIGLVMGTSSVTLSHAFLCAGCPYYYITVQPSSSWVVGSVGHQTTLPSCSLAL